MTSITINESKYENEFDIICEIGAGTFGEVINVKNKESGDLFAIKIIQIKNEANDESFNENLNKIEKEIKILSKLKSDFVVQYICHWFENKPIDHQIHTFVYIQMELCSHNLEQIIDLINDSIDENQKVFKYFIRSQLLVKVIECLNHLHSLKPPIIHRDLKPQNILLTKESNKTVLKLCDFGLSKELESSLNTRGVGTEKYMAPEIKDYEKYDKDLDKSHYNLKSDVYSLGVIAIELFNLKKRVKKIREIEKIIDELSANYSKTIVEEKYAKFLRLISHMVSEERDDRPGCVQLLEETHEWNVDPGTIKRDENFEMFINIIRNDKNLEVIQKLF